MASDRIRELRDKFWKERSHLESKPSSLVPSSDDNTVIFNIAGMQPLVPYLTGKVHPQGTKLFNIQRCIRTVDIEEVGDERHCTFFEMMGNWSLGDYFKKESLERSIDFLINHVGLDKNKLGCSIFGGLFDGNGKEIIPYDKEAENVLLANGIDPEKIKAIPMTVGKKCDNWRGPAGAIGPCGPSAEFHYDRGENRGPNDWDIGENDRFIEIRNNVFMEYYKDKEGNFTPLSQKNIDTGMGLERLMMVIDDADTVFETDLFLPIISYIEEITQTTYPALHKKSFTLSEQEETLTKSYRIISDHIRAVSFLIMDGVIPSNESRGYVCRRLIRRLYYHLSKIYTDATQLENNNTLESKIHGLTHIIVNHYRKAYPQLVRESENIAKTLTKEITNFQKTIKKGRKLLGEYLSESSNKLLLGSHIFKLHDTFGFPLELTKEIAEEQGYTIDESGFKEHMKKAKELAKQASHKKFNKDIDRASYLTGIEPTKFIGRETITQKDMKILKDFEVDGQRVIIFEASPFYAEGGGQTGDTGVLVDKDGTELTVTNVKKYDGVHLHFIK